MSETMWMWTSRLSFEKRKDQAQCAMGRRLFEIIIKKQSNLAVAADVTTVADLLSIADKASNLKLEHLRTLCSNCGACIY